MPYRDELPNPRNPREEAAIVELVTKTKAVRAIIIVAHVLLGVLLGSVLYSLLEDWQMEHRGGHIPYVTGMISMLPTFGAMLRLAPFAVRAVIRVLVPVWRRTIAAKYGLDLASFEELTTLIGR